MTVSSPSPPGADRIRVGFIIGSTRPGRVGEAVARWVFEIAQRRTDAEYELVDLAEYHLPLLDEPIPAGAHRYSKEHTKAWAEKVATFDAFVFVTPEYNHGPPASLKNALDFVGSEWFNKAAGFVSYGSAGGIRAVEQLRLVLAELQVATVKAQAWFSLINDFENRTTFKPSAGKEQSVTNLLDQLVAWGRALKTLRSGAP